MQNKVKVEILNQTYTINGDAQPEYILQLAEYVDAKMKEVCQHNTSCSPAQAAILVALNIADEYFQIKKIRSRQEGIMEQKTEALISLLEEGLVGDVFSRLNA
jgi:cell division protein ZapA